MTNNILYLVPPPHPTPPNSTPLVCVSCVWFGWNILYCLRLRLRLRLMSALHSPCTPRWRWSRPTNVRSSDGWLCCTHEQATSTQRAVEHVVCGMWDWVTIIIIEHTGLLPREMRIYRCYDVVYATNMYSNSSSAYMSGVMMLHVVCSDDDMSFMTGERM